MTLLCLTCGLRLTTQDVHSRFRTEAHNDVIARFNERFILSLASCESCLVVDDELNVLPISAHARKLAPVDVADDGKDEDDSAVATAATTVLTSAQRELASLKETISSTPLVGALAKLTKTLDQARTILTCADVLSEKSLRGIVAITAGRGRVSVRMFFLQRSSNVAGPASFVAVLCSLQGKSAALGLSIAAAIGYGYSNIFVTAPHPENLKTVFEFVFKVRAVVGAFQGCVCARLRLLFALAQGFDALAYKEHADYEAIVSTNPEFNKAIVRVNVFREHRQTIQFIQPHDSDKLSQAELVVIDEAAAIPLPLVKKLMVPCVVFMASTINGYEGTGRSLSLKLISQLRKQSATLSGSTTAAGSSSAALVPAAGGAGARKLGGKALQEVELAEPIRYNPGDPIEAWLNDLLCLDSHTAYKLTHGLPPPADCELYYVDRDALFSYHKVPVVGW